MAVDVVMVMGLGNVICKQTGTSIAERGKSGESGRKSDAIKWKGAGVEKRVTPCTNGSRSCCV